MYIIEIINKETHQRVGPTFHTGYNTEIPKLVDGIAAAQRWLTEQAKEKSLSPGDYRIVPRIVGCL